MNKSELVQEVSRDSGITQRQVKEIVEAVVATIKTAVAKGEPVEILGLGVFSSAKRRARVGRNPVTGDQINIPAKTVPVFKAYKAFKNLVG